MGAAVETDAASRHLPVMVEEVVAALRPGPGMRLLDCTCGLGGHGERLLEAGAMVTGVDRDAEALALATQRLERFQGRFTPMQATFADQVESMVARGERVDGVLADLGVSSLQLDEVERGFSLRADAPLDLRMDPSQGEPARALVVRLDAEALATVIYELGEEHESRRIARALKQAEAEGRLATCRDLAETVRACVRGHRARHPALRTFQALRIAVNDELGQLDRLLACLPDLLVPGGRAVLISFHSLEDRRVKMAFKAHRANGRLTEASRKVITASDPELAANPRSHSAKLRWAIR